MPNRKLAPGCRLIVCLMALAPVLSAGIVKCGDGVFCDWMVDTPTWGFFIMLHPKAITVTEDPMKGLPHSFVSPSGYWTVVFDTFQQYDAPDSPFTNHDYVDLIGYMQHLKRPPGDLHAADPMVGDKFSFNLLMLEGINPSDDQRGTENHGHIDTYHALITGTDAKAPKTGTLSYTFGVEGRHTEFFETPPGVPEPSTILLVGAALAWPLWKRSG